MTMPNELRTAAILLWISFVMGTGATVVDLAAAPGAPDFGVVVVTAAFGIFIAMVTYYFSMARNWARIASLVLLGMNLIGGFWLPTLFGRSPLAAWLYIGELIPEAIAMYIAFATPASKLFVPSSGDDPAMRAILPVGRSGWAIAAGYLALFSVLLLPAPFALVTGILALRDIRRHPEKHGKGRAIFGIVMGALGTLALVWVFGLGMSRR